MAPFLPKPQNTSQTVFTFFTNLQFPKKWTNNIATILFTTKHSTMRRNSPESGSSQFWQRCRSCWWRSSRRQNQLFLSGGRSRLSWEMCSRRRWRLTPTPPSATALCRSRCCRRRSRAQWSLSWGTSATTSDSPLNTGGSSREVLWSHNMWSQGSETPKTETRTCNRSGEPICCWRWSITG